MELKRTPLHGRHLQLGARMVPFAGWDMPVQYEGLMQEHMCVRSAVGLFDVSHMGEVFVRGANAFRAVQWLVSNDVGRLEDGEALYTVMCNENGGVVDDLVVYRLSAECFMICVNAANREKDFQWMLNHNPFEAEIVDESDAWGQIAVQGPNAKALAARVCALPLDQLKPFEFVNGTVGDVAGCMIARTGYTGEDGVEVFAPADKTALVWDALIHQGADLGVRPIGLGARDTLRLEARFCLYGHELNDELSPWQARLAWVTKMDKEGGFVGRDALAQRKGNESHRLVGLLMEGKRIPRAEMRIKVEGKDVGWVTSGTRSPCMTRGIALGYVEKAYTRPGTSLVVDVRGREAEAKVFKGPFFNGDLE